MTTNDLARMDGFEIVVPAGERALERVYCADLLSWAMARAPAGGAWCTVMGNVNAVAVAELADVAAIVLCEGAALADDAAQKADEHGICVARTPLPAFDAGLAIARAAGLYGLG